MSENETANLKSVFSDIYKQNTWGDKESRSGGGSTLVATQDIRKALPKLIRKYKITSMLDCPCGDFNWMRGVNLENIDYTGADIVEELILANEKSYAAQNRRFISLDLTASVPPAADLVFVRDCFIHLDFKNIALALENIKKSGSKYLLTTTYPTTKVNTARTAAETVYAKKFWNLELAPFSLPKPLRYVKDRRPGLKQKRMGLWSIESL